MQPTFETARLILRPFEFSDSREVQRLAGDYDVAKTTLSMPHPYPDGAAQSWITAVREAAESGKIYAFAVTSQETHELMGTMSLRVDSTHNRGEIAYWIGKGFWGHGYATEAAQRIISFGFQVLRLNKVWATAFADNPASWTVMKKVGMKQEGMLREHAMKWGQPKDLVYYGLLTSEYN